MSGKAGYVYILRPIGTTGIYKIGCTVNLDRRLAEHNSRPRGETRPVPLMEYIAFIFSQDCEWAEQVAHARFGNYKICHEWYALPDSVIESIKAEAAQNA